ncbi:hypothetical protein ACAW74_24170 [Fibrella sp. WM1]|uniref:hypothetical protein n=1 Tax=Fibrella musci TaxID=3242485 RepID=UPI00351FCAE2
MKTTLIALFKAINEAQAALIAERDSLTDEAQKTLLRQAIKQLDQLANDILILDLAQQANEIEAQVAKLTALSEKIEETSDHLANIALILDDITRKIGAVLQAVSLLSGVGLIA